MGKLAELLAEREKFKNEGLEIAKSFDPENSEQVTALRTARENLDKLDEQIVEARKNEDDLARFRSAQDQDDKDRERKRPGMYAGKDGEEQVLLTPGEQYVASDAYRAWMEQFPGGGPTTEGVVAQGLGAQVGSYRHLLGMRTATERWRGGIITPVKARALITSADASAGELVRPDFRGLLEPGLVRPLTIRQLVTVIPVTSDAIEYVKEASRTSNAASVDEATALTGSTGTKPEGGLAFSLVVDTVHTIAEWVPATKRILADATGLRAYIDQYLTDDLSIELEDQMINGGGGSDFTGILNAGVGTVTSGGDNNLDRIRIAKRVIQVSGRTNATAVVANPEDAADFETIKASTAGTYLGGGPFGTSFTTIWGIPLVESEAIAAGHALVGDFRRAVLFDREDVTISVGTVNDDFIRNLVRVLAEMRAAFGVLRPGAFVDVTLA